MIDFYSLFDLSIEGNTGFAKRAKMYLSYSIP